MRKETEIRKEGDREREEQIERERKRGRDILEGEKEMVHTDFPGDAPMNKAWRPGQGLHPHLIWAQVLESGSVRISGLIAYEKWCDTHVKKVQTKELSALLRFSNLPICRQHVRNIQINERNHYFYKNLLCHPEHFPVNFSHSFI